MINRSHVSQIILSTFSLLLFICRSLADVFDAFRMLPTRALRYLHLDAEHSSAAAPLPDLVHKRHAHTKYSLDEDARVGYAIANRSMRQGLGSRAKSRCRHPVMV